MAWRTENVKLLWNRFGTGQDQKCSVWILYPGFVYSLINPGRTSLCSHVSPHILCDKYLHGCFVALVLYFFSKGNPWVLYMRQRSLNTQLSHARTPCCQNWADWSISRSHWAGATDASSSIGAPTTTFCNYIHAELIKKSYHTSQIFSWEFWHQLRKDILIVLYGLRKNWEHWTGMVGDGNCSTTDVVLRFLAFQP